MTDTISDMLTRIRNAGRANLPTVAMSHSRLKESIAQILKSQGYISEVTVEGTGQKCIRLRLKYQGTCSVIEGIQRVSKPGLRRYVGAGETPRVRGGLGISILTTSQGVMTGAEARKKNLGGELICFVW